MVELDFSLLCDAEKESVVTPFLSKLIESSSCRGTVARRMSGWIFSSSSSQSKAKYAAACYVSVSCQPYQRLLRLTLSLQEKVSVLLVVAVLVVPYVYWVDVLHTCSIETRKSHLIFVPTVLIGALDCKGVHEEVILVIGGLVLIILGMITNRRIDSCWY